MKTTMAAAGGAVFIAGLCALGWLIATLPT